MTYCAKCGCGCACTCELPPAPVDEAAPICKICGTPYAPIKPTGYKKRCSCKTKKKSGREIEVQEHVRWSYEVLTWELNSTRSKRVV